ncbi:MAG: hypothetical protein AAF717_13245 [Bacteroidota bacterium]
MKRILIIEDEPTLSDAYVFILNGLLEKNKIDAFKAYVCNDFQKAIKTIKEMAGSSEIPELCILDYRLKITGSDDENGLDLGIMVREHFPSCKIMLITSIADKYLYHTIIEILKPAAFLIKSEIDYRKTGEDILSVLEGKLIYSKTIYDFVKDDPYIQHSLDNLDMKLLKLLSERMSLAKIASKLELSVSGVEYRKRKLSENSGRIHLALTIYYVHMKKKSVFPSFLLNWYIKNVRQKTCNSSKKSSFLLN